MKGPLSSNSTQSFFELATGNWKLIEAIRERS